MNRLELLEWQLGDPAEYILRERDKPSLVEWALAKGYAPVDVHAMSAVALANLYHGGEATETPTALQRAAADIFMPVMETVGTSFDEELIRYLARQEIERATVFPRRLEIVTPTATTILNGPTHYMTETVIKVVSLGHAAMLVGPAGCGKTTIGEHVSQALNLPLYITNTVNDTHELTGFVDGYGKYHSTPYRRVFENGGVWIADEIDAWDAGALLTANSGLANGFATFPDMVEPVRRHANFRMVATANTYGVGADRIYIGRNELDAASLDRFATINVDYDLTLERMFCGGNDRWLDHVWQVRRRVQEKHVRHVVSSRCIAMGAAALAIGMTWEEVEGIYLYKGMSEKDREKIA